MEVQERVFLPKRASAAGACAAPEVRVAQKWSVYEQCPPRCSPPAPCFISPSRRWLSELRGARQLCRHLNKLKWRNNRRCSSPEGTQTLHKSGWRLLISRTISTKAKQVPRFAINQAERGHYAGSHTRLITSESGRRNPKKPPRRALRLIRPAPEIWGKRRRMIRGGRSPYRQKGGGGLGFVRRW